MFVVKFNQKRHNKYKFMFMAKMFFSKKYKYCYLYRNSRSVHS